MTDQSSQENKPVGDVAELIEWHTPDTPARPASRQHESAPQVENADRPASDVARPVLDLEDETWRPREEWLPADQLEQA